MKFLWLLLLTPTLWAQGGMMPGPGTPHSAGAACGTYVHYRVITVPAQSTLSGNLSNYPVLVSGTYSYLATVANGGLVQNASGFDVGFFTDNTCSTKLPWETETYAASSGAVNYWVQVPTISKTASITFVMAYDNAAITTDQSNKTGTWDANFWAVYHLPDGTTLNKNDSTSNANNLTSTGVPTAATGQIDGAASFPGGAFLSAAPTGEPTGNTPRTMSTWIKFGSTGGVQVTNYFGVDNGSRGAYGLYLNGTTISCEFGSSAGLVTGGVLSASTWYYLVVTYSGTANTIYVNGTSAGSTSFSTANGVAGNVSVGSGFGGQTVSAGTIMDESRYSNVARSADWIKTDYNSQSSPSTFYSVGSQF